MGFALEAISRKLGGIQASYVSAPITTGWKFIEWYRATGRDLKGSDAYETSHRIEVVKANAARAIAAIERIRAREAPTPIVEPISFCESEWSQADYRCFWGMVIQRHAKRAFFVDGWEASIGCVYEFSVAVRERIPIYNERHGRIQYVMARDQIRAAISAMQSLELDTNLLSKLVLEIGAFESA